MKIYIWGTGRGTGNILGRFITLDDIEGFINNDINKKEYMHKKVIHPQVLLKLDFDLVLVATEFSKEIAEQCTNLGIDTSKFIFIYQNYTINDMNKDYNFITKIFGKDFADFIKDNHIIKGVDAFGDLCFRKTKYKDPKFKEIDYIRIKIFELAVKELRKRNIQGAIAELGVYRGEFAQLITHFLIENFIYLIHLKALMLMKRKKK